MLMPRTARAGLVLMLALTVAACGGSPGAGPSPTTSATGAAGTPALLGPSATSAPSAQATAATATTATQTQAAPVSITPATATTASATSVPEAPTASSAVAGATITSAPAMTATTARADPHLTPGPAITAEATRYSDDRSTPQAVLTSLYNAINQRQYARAYSYWETPGAIGLPPFPQFQQGYANTQSVRLEMGPVLEDAGAGQRYDAVPVTLIATTTAGAQQTFVGCYTLHLALPAIQAAPPFHPLAIRSAEIRPVAGNANTTQLMAQACRANGQPAGLPVPASPTPDPADISAARYLDDRSAAEQVVRSLYNAINRKEYARAYAYWETSGPPPGPPPFPQFQQGYAKTQAVQLNVGSVQSGAAAGNYYGMVPVTVRAATSGGGRQTFVGCYTVHLGEPANQAVPPFQPMAIQAAHIQQVPNAADTGALMRTVCGNR